MLFAELGKRVARAAVCSMANIAALGLAHFVLGRLDERVVAVVVFLRSGASALGVAVDAEFAGAIRHDQQAALILGSMDGVAGQADYLRAPSAPHFLAVGPTPAKEFLFGPNFYRMAVHTQTDPFFAGISAVAVLADGFPRANKQLFLG